MCVFVRVGGSGRYFWSWHFWIGCKET